MRTPALTLTAAPGTPAALPEDESSLRGTVFAAVGTIVCLATALTGWGLFAHLDSAVIASGLIVVDSHRKTVQHLEGGILRELLVREGQQVRAGQPLAILDTTQAESQLSQLTNQLVAQRASIARLQAEQQDRHELVFPPELIRTAEEAHIGSMVNVEGRVFESRWRAYESSIALSKNRIEQLRKQIAATQAQAGADTKRLALYEEEAGNVAYLLERGYERRPRLLELQRNIADLKGRRGEQDNQIAQALEEIAGAELQIVSLRDNRLAEVARDLADAQAKEADLVDRIRAAKDILQRREIVSPQDGVVVDPRLVTPGGVIGPGQPLMDIVPVDDRLLVETRIDPVDIDVVHEGLPTQVRLTGFKRNLYPPIDGRVAYVSADKLNDPKTGEPYFLARVTFDPQALSAWTGGALSPGMPGEVIIITGQRRAIDYLLSPLTDRMRHAFREE